MAEQFSNNGNNKRNPITKEVREYVEKRIQLLTLTIAEQVSHIIAESFQRTMGMFVLSFALFFLWFSVGFLLGELFDSLSAGFAVASVPIFILGLVLMRTKSKRLIEKIQAQLISKVLDDLDESDESEVKKIEGKKIGQK